MVDEMLTLDPNPFKKPIDAPNGDTDARKVFASVGYALSAWEHAETALATMFSLLMRPTGGRHVPFRAFGGIFSSGSRRELIELAVEAYFAILSTPCDGPTKARGNDLHEEIKKFLKHHERFHHVALRRRRIIYI